jgi:tetratricopeptide (TPR) repeat protein
LFRLEHATWGDERLRAAQNMLALYPDFAFAHFQQAMVHVARGHLADAETVLRQGAAVQDRQIGRGGRYPALGLHWLLGLVRLALEDVEEAIVEFDREAKLAEPHRLYGREFTMSAWYGRGEALLRAKRIDEAIDAFERARTLYPDHTRIHLGLARAFSDRGSSADAAVAVARAADALAIVQRTRPLQARLFEAHLHTSRGRLSDAVATLDTLVKSAPPGFTGWTIPVEPFARQLHTTQGFNGVLAGLADRAK